MHAALVTVTVDPVRASAAATALTNDILPGVRSAPGFVAGYWLEPEESRGFSIVLFDTEEQAIRASPPASDWSAPGVTIETVSIRKVAVAI